MDEAKKYPGFLVFKNLQALVCPRHQEEHFVT